MAPILRRMILLDLMMIMEEHLELDPNRISENYDLEPASFKTVKNR